MADSSEQSVFLERRSYRRRRLRDGIKALPVLAIWLFMLPLLWPNAAQLSQTPTPMSSALIYIFAVWAGVILVKAIMLWIWRRLNAALGEDQPAR